MVVVTVPFGMFVGVRYLAPLLYGPPVTVLAARIMDGEEIHPGGFLRILITATIRNQLTCGGSLSREFSKFTRLSDGDVVPEISRDYLIGPPISRAGMGRYITDVQLTKAVGHGDWEFVGLTTMDCGFWGGIYSFRTPPIRFTVTPEKASQ